MLALHGYVEARRRGPRRPARVSAGHRRHGAGHLMKKRTLVSLVALSAVAYAGYHYLGGKKDGPPRFTTQKVDKGPIVAHVTASGTLSALVTVQVGIQGSWRIVELAADFNSPVQKEQIIAKLDPELFQAAVDQAKANLLTDQGNLEKAKV